MRQLFFCPQERVFFFWGPEKGKEKDSPHSPGCASVGSYEDTMNEHDQEGKQDRSMRRSKDGDKENGELGEGGNALKHVRGELVRIVVVWYRHRRKGKP